MGATAYKKITEKRRLINKLKKRYLENDLRLGQLIEAYVKRNIFYIPDKEFDKLLDNDL